MGATAAVGALIIAWLRYRATVTGLVAKVEAHQFALPSYLAEGPRLVADRLGWRDFLSEIGGVPEDTKIEISDRIRQHINEVFPRDTQMWGERFRAYWTVDVTNNGRNTAEEVALRVPQAKRVRVVREGKDPVEQDVSAVIELGSIRPGETVAIHAWGGGLYSTDLHDVRLVQKSGRAKVLRFDRVAPFWKWISEYWEIVLFALFLIMLVTGGIFSSK